MASRSNLTVGRSLGIRIGDRWVAIFMQRFGKPSAFGELWYAEADSPTGPWGPAVKILSHDNYTFYNPRIHWESIDAKSPVLLFEGTYTQQFADHPTPTPRYDYNQILYRLDLDDPDLRPAGRSDADASREPEVMQGIRVSDDGTHFVGDRTGDRFVVWGVNYDHDGKGDCSTNTGRPMAHGRRGLPGNQSAGRQLRADPSAIRRFMEAPGQPNAGSTRPACQARRAWPRKPGSTSM